MPKSGTVHMHMYGKEPCVVRCSLHTFKLRLKEWRHSKWKSVSSCLSACIGMFLDLIFNDISMQPVYSLFTREATDHIIATVPLQD